MRLGDNTALAYMERVESVIRECTAETQRRTGFRANDVAIPARMTFLEWCEGLGRAGLKVGGQPFSLHDRPALRHLYEMVPATREQARKFRGVVMKGAQTGATVWEMLVMIYMALKFEPVSLGMYLPSQALAAHNSTYRLLPIIRSVPVAHERLLGSAVNANRPAGSKEGNVLTRSLRDSLILMLWTSGSVTTESYPLDMVFFDEVQEISISQIEKTRERMSGSYIGMELDASTANWPGADIDLLYTGGTRERFHTECKCVGGVILDEVFPRCIEYSTGQIKGAPTGQFVYVCPTCRSYIPDPQTPAKIAGAMSGWLAENPQAPYRSIHFPQTLSVTMGPGDIIQKFRDARDLKNFYNRTLGKPWANPDQIPITDAVLAACVADGATMGSAWLESGKDCYMGIDQMGQFNVVVVKRRAADGRRETVHLEMIFDDDPFARCSVLMRQYGVAVCVVEGLPNYNDAKRFAHRHSGRVWVGSYTDMKDDMLRWGDVTQTRAERKTLAEERDRYTVVMDQYKCMSVSLHYFVDRQALIPPPNGLEQDVLEKGEIQRSAICREYYFHHLKKVALVTKVDDPDKKDATHKPRSKVVKIGIDPHFAYANMLCDVAYARAHGTAGFILPPDEAAVRQGEIDRAVKRRAPGLPVEVTQIMDQVAVQQTRGTCGACSSFDPARKFCKLRNWHVAAKDPECELFTPAGR